MRKTAAPARLGGEFCFPYRDLFWRSSQRERARQLVRLKKRNGGAGAAGARGAAAAVDEELRLSGEVVVDDVVEEWDVDAARGDVSHDEHLRDNREMGQGEGLHCRAR